MKRKGHARLLIVATLTCVALGAWISGRLLKQHAGDFWGAQAGQPALLGQLCNSAASLGFNCTDAAHGAYSELSLPVPLPTRNLMLQIKTVTIPVAFLGLSYFVMLGCWVAFIGPARPRGRRWHRLLLGFTLAGVCSSIFFIGLMAFGRAPWCLPCLAVHALNFLLFPMIRKLCRAQTPVSEPATELAARLILTTREVVSVTAFALLAIAGLWHYQTEQLEFRRQYRKLMPYREFVQRLQQNPEFLAREFHAQPIHDFPDDDPADILPRLTVFTDFQCRSCYCNWHKIRTEILAMFDGQLTLSLRHFPLCLDCNDEPRDNLHPEACRAAYAAEAARLQGGPEAALRMHELLFRNQKRLVDTVYRDLAIRLDLDPDRLLRDMNDPRVRQIVADDVALAKKLGVNSTPTMFLNGRRVPDLCRTPVFWQAMATGFRAAPELDLAASTPPPADVRLQTTIPNPILAPRADEVNSK